MPRRVVTAQTGSGKSVIALDEELAPDELADGSSYAQVWGYDEAPFRLPSDGTPPAFETWFPPPAGVRVALCEWPPGVPGESIDETDSLGPDVRATLEKGDGRPGFHVSDTVDVAIVLSGRINLQLDDSEVTLEPGDWLVQNGTSHSWRVPGPEPCRLVFVLVGAERRAQEVK